MSQVYDDAATHHDRLPGDRPRKAAATHLGMFFAWCAEHGLLSDWHDRTHPGELARLQSRWHSGRDYVLQFLDGQLTSDHLGPEGQAFAADYLAGGAYLRDYEEALRGARPSLYHVPDTWEVYEELEPVLDRAFAAWQGETQVSPGSVATHAAATAVLPETPDLSVAATVPADVAAPEFTAPDATVPVQPPMPDTPAPVDDGRGTYDEVVRRDGVAQPPPLPPRAEHRPLARPKRGNIVRRVRRAQAGGRKGKGTVWAVVVVALLIYGCQLTTAAKRRNARPTEQDFERIFREHEGRRRERLRPIPVVPTRQRSRVTETLPVVAWGEVDAAQTAAAQALGVPVRFENDVHMRFVLIPAGAFVMGSPPTEPERDAGEVQHNVAISRPYYLMTTEVSNALYRQFRVRHQSETPRGFRGFDDPHVPVTSVSWDDAKAFCDWLSELDATRVYRLPTEAEWEYACRAGSSTRFPWGDSEADASNHANLADETMRLGMRAQQRAQVEREAMWRWWPGRDNHVGLAPVGAFGTNTWGLYDMIGNAHEWCADWAAPYDAGMAADPLGPGGGAVRIIRGGAADAPVWKGRSAWRGAWNPRQTAPNLGFRVVVPVPAR